MNLFYATYAKGFRPGGVNAPLPAAVLWFDRKASERAVSGLQVRYDAKLRDRLEEQLRRIS
jgi:hypothetical protein